MFHGEKIESMFSLLARNSLFAGGGFIKLYTPPNILLPALLRKRSLVDFFQCLEIVEALHITFYCPNLNCIPQHIVNGADAKTFLCISFCCSQIL